MSVTHIAGPDLNIAGRVIQRCSLCGEKLIDSLNEARPLNPDGTDPGVSTWEVGRLVRVNEGNPKRSVLLPPPEHDFEGQFFRIPKLPRDSCIKLIEP